MLMSTWQIENLDKTKKKHSKWETENLNQY